MVSWIYYNVEGLIYYLSMVCNFGLMSNVEIRWGKLAGSCLWDMIVARPLNAYIYPGKAPREHH